MIDVKKDLALLQKHVKEKYKLEPYMILKVNSTCSNGNNKVSVGYDLTITSEDLNTRTKLRLPFNRSFKGYESVEKIIENL